ncbi:MAG: response regulator [Candidatus Zixiibacteriota bacterium]
MDRPVRALIVDDEPLARKRIMTLLSSFADITVIGEAANGVEAIEAIRRRTPDLVFLDVQMPGLDGFDVIREIGTERMPMVIFVTAFDTHAVKAFEVNALDYLLKPFDKSRFAKALERAFGELRHRKPAGQLSNLLAAATMRPPEEMRLLVRTFGRVTIVIAGQIDWIRSAGNYAELHVGHETHLLRETMQTLGARLRPAGFVRIHRGYIINKRRVRSLRIHDDGDGTVLLHDHTELPLSRRYRRALDQMLHSDQ